LFRATGRHPWRPAHFHFIVIAKGYRTLVTEVFPEDDPYADEDAVFGVRRELCVSLKHQTTSAALPPGLLVDVAPPFYTVDFDIKLARS
ncbi:MAG: hydroxyquinol 1,2-dioxygenase, partial [Alphaproteobacteria bacterium]